MFVKNQDHEAEIYKIIKQFYRYANKIDSNGSSLCYREFECFIKASISNPATKGLKQEMLILKRLPILNREDIFPKFIDYKEIDFNGEVLEILVTQYHRTFMPIRDYLNIKALDEIREIIYILWKAGINHGDIKIDNFIACTAGLRIIDFDQASLNVADKFEETGDMIGNIYADNLKMNYKELCKEVEDKQWKKKK